MLRDKRLGENIPRPLPSFQPPSLLRYWYLVVTSATWVVTSVTHQIPVTTWVTEVTTWVTEVTTWVLVFGGHFGSACITPGSPVLRRGHGEKFIGPALQVALLGPMEKPNSVTACVSGLVRAWFCRACRVDVVGSGLGANYFLTSKGLGRFKKIMWPERHVPHL